MMKTLPLYSDVILLRNLPQHSLSAGDVGEACHFCNELFLRPFNCFLMYWIDRILEQVSIELKSAYDLYRNKIPPS
jgi:hypothetical protein